MFKKQVVIDTNVIMNDPYCYRKFPDSDVIIPLVVISELDNHKTGLTELNKNVREFIRQMDRLLKFEDPEKGVALGNGSELFIINSDGYGWDTYTNDDKIIHLAKRLNDSGTHGKVTVISNDLNVRIKAKSLGLEAEGYEGGEKVDDQAYQGFREITEEELSNKFCPNEYAILKNNKKPLLRWDKKERTHKPVNLHKSVWGLSPKNVGQKFALDALMDPDIKLVTITGSSGSGKTILALSAALEQCIGNSQYKKIMICKPVVPMGNDLGYLPGDIGEKLAPWMGSIFDNLEVLCNGTDELEFFQSKNLLKIEPLTYIRGRSIHNQFIILDEAQQLSTHEIKAILTRAGEGTKIVLIGDVSQIDTPKLDSINNGLAYAIESFKNEPIASHINLTKCERSELAEISVKVLK